MRGFERLWAPWRMEYIRASRHELAGGCIFCDRPAEGDDEANHILARTPRAFVILNAFPYNPGHLMVAPYRHVAGLEELEDGEIGDVFALLRRSVEAIKAHAEPDGFNIGMNLGRVSGAGVPGHLHWHVVPRWEGDTNFMPVVGEIRVVPEALDATYQQLRPHFG